jgi:hypothetical protein
LSRAAQLIANTLTFELTRERGLSVAHRKLASGVPPTTTRQTTRSADPAAAGLKAFNGHRSTIA